MNKYLFLFCDEAEVVGWECFDPKEPVSDAMAVQQAFNMLIGDDSCDHVVVFAYGRATERLLICTIEK